MIVNYYLLYTTLFTFTIHVCVFVFCFNNYLFLKYKQEFVTNILSTYLVFLIAMIGSNNLLSAHRIISYFTLHYAFHHQPHSF
jgi:hypothetical protein